MEQQYQQNPLILSRIHNKFLLSIFMMIFIEAGVFGQFKSQEIPLKIGVGSYFVDKGDSPDENHFTFSFGREWAIKKSSMLMADLGFVTTRNLFNGDKYETLSRNWILLDFAYAYQIELSSRMNIKPMIGEAWRPLDDEDGFVDYLIESINFFIGSDVQVSKGVKQYGLSCKWYASTFVPSEGFDNYSIKFYMIYPF